MVVPSQALRKIIVLALIVFLWSGSSNPSVAGWAERIVATADVDGIAVFGLRPPEDAAYDFPIISPDDAVALLVTALQRILRDSPFSAAQIEKLKAAGRVSIIYDPDTPDRSTNLAGIIAALFLPQRDGVGVAGAGQKQFPVVVTRYGIKWPLKELAPVLIHELVGHGIQHLENRLDTMRQIDFECEAWLYTEMGHQDVGAANFTDERIEYRKQLEFQCDDFLRHLRLDDPDGYRVWDTLDPDIPLLLTHFHQYLDTLRESGVMATALENDAALSAGSLDMLFRDGAAEEQYQVGLMLLQGRGLDRDVHEGRRWMIRAGERGHADAIFYLGILYEEGNGVEKDRAKAVDLYELAAKKGSSRAADRLKKLQILD